MNREQVKTMTVTNSYINQCTCIIGLGVNRLQTNYRQGTGIQIDQINKTPLRYQSN